MRFTIIDYICSMKINGINIKKVILAIVAPLVIACGAMAQREVGSPTILSGIIAKPRFDAPNALKSYLDLKCKDGSKAYLNTFSVFEEMLSEPTWDYHNEELFTILVEHASTAYCLNENERMRPKAMLEIVHKNAPGTVANDIDYETIDGSKHQLSNIATPYTLIYFNDPECFSCEKVKQRLDTCSILKDMVSDSTLTVVGIYPYDNVDEWRQESFPTYIINGWDYKQKVDGEATYDLMTMPLFYLLDRDKHVILKNEASLNCVLRVLTHIKGKSYTTIDQLLNDTWNWTISPRLLEMVRELRNGNY